MFNIISIIYMIMSMILINRVGAVGTPDIKVIPGSSMLGNSLPGLGGNFAIQGTIPLTPNIDIETGYHRVGPMFGSGHQSKYMGGFRFKF